MTKFEISKVYTIRLQRSWKYKYEFEANFQFLIDIQINTGHLNQQTSKRTDTSKLSRSKQEKMTVKGQTVLPRH